MVSSEVIENALILDLRRESKFRHIRMILSRIASIANIEIINGEEDTNIKMSSDNFNECKSLISSYSFSHKKLIEDASLSDSIILIGNRKLVLQK